MSPVVLPEVVLALCCLCVVQLALIFALVFKPLTNHTGEEK